MIDDTWDKFYPEENATVSVERKISGMRKARLFLMKSHDKRFIESITDQEATAIYEIQQAQSFYSGGMQIKTIDLNHIPSAPKDDYTPHQIDILNAYCHWCDVMAQRSPQARGVLDAIARGEGFKEVGEGQFMSYHTAKRLLNIALEEYISIRGWNNNKPTRRPPSPRQQELLDFIFRHVEQTGNAPTYDEMTKGINLKSRGAVHHMVDKLEEYGWLSRIKGKLVLF